MSPIPDQRLLASNSLCAAVILLARSVRDAHTASVGHDRWIDPLVGELIAELQTTQVPGVPMDREADLYEAMFGIVRETMRPTSPTQCSVESRFGTSPRR